MTAETFHKSLSKIKMWEKRGKSINELIPCYKGHELDFTIYGVYQLYKNYKEAYENVLKYYDDNGKVIQ